MGKATKFFRFTIFIFKLLQFLCVQLCDKIYKNVCEGNAHTFNDKRKFEDNFS